MELCFLSAIEDGDDSGALPQVKDGESSIPSVVKTFIVMEQVALAATTIGIGKQAFVGSSRTHRHRKAFSIHCSLCKHLCLSAQLLSLSHTQIVNLAAYRYSTDILL